MTDEKAAHSRIERFFLVDSEDLFYRLQPYYDLIDAARKSVYHRFITSTDMSPDALKECISEEASAIEQINSNVCIGIGKTEVTTALRPLYRKLKSAVKKNQDKPPFYHVNIMKQGDGFKKRTVSFVPPALKFDAKSNLRICNDSIPMPGVLKIIKETEFQYSCKLTRITFDEVGSAEYDNVEYDWITYIELRFEKSDTEDK